MKSLSSMAPDQLRPLAGGNSSSRSQIIRSCLPIVVTTLLVLFLGGFPPTTWMLLFQTLGELKVLLTYHGPEMILPVVILIVQSLLLVVAWVLLGWVILREGAYLMTMQSKAELDRLLAYQSSTSQLINPSQMVTKQLQLEQDFNEMTDMFAEDQDYNVTTDPLEQEQEYSRSTDPLEQEQEYSRSTAPLRRSKQADMTTTPLRRGKDYSQATAQLGITTSSLRDEEAEEDAWVSQNVRSRSAQLPGVSSRSNVQSRSTQLSNMQSKDMQTRDLPSRTVHLPEMQYRGVQSRNAQNSNMQSKSTQSANAQSRTGQSRNMQTSRMEPDDVQTHNFQSRNLQSRRAPNLRRTGRLPEEDSLENPFEKELPSTPEEDNNVGKSRTRMLKKQEEILEEDKEEDDDNPFVFGNPFDGPLPEVFRYDVELRRSVMELNEEETSKSNGSKGSEAQKTKRS